jgi:DnaJ domain
LVHAFCDASADRHSTSIRTGPASLPTQPAIPEFDLYATLGVPLDADSRTIEDAWRAGVRSSHPDRAQGEGNLDATERTARLNVAREWLIDPSKRAQYDQLRRPAKDVDLPTTDRLAPWPDRRSPRPVGRPMWIVPALVALLVLVATLVVGIGTSYVTVAAFALSLVMVIYYGLMGLLGRFG